MVTHGGPALPSVSCGRLVELESLPGLAWSDLVSIQATPALLVRAPLARPMRCELRLGSETFMPLLALPVRDEAAFLVHWTWSTSARRSEAEASAATVAREPGRRKRARNEPPQVPLLAPADRRSKLLAAAAAAPLAAAASRADRGATWSSTTTTKTRSTTEAAATTAASADGPETEGADALWGELGLPEIPRPLAASLLSWFSSTGHRRRKPLPMTGLL